MEDIGARRLHTIMTILLENYLYDLPDPKVKKVKVGKQDVQQVLGKVLTDEDLTKYIL
jgi:ATP-dependent HslUV protease ATP-binding subunit HslU